MVYPLCHPAVNWYSHKAFTGMTKDMSMVFKFVEKKDTNELSGIENHCILVPVKFSIRKKWKVPK